MCDEAHELITYENKYQTNKKGGDRYEIKPSSGLLMLEKLHARHKWYMTGTPLPHAEKSLRGALKVGLGLLIFTEYQMSRGISNFKTPAMTRDEKRQNYNMSRVGGGGGGAGGGGGGVGSVIHPFQIFH